MAREVDGPVRHRLKHGRRGAALSERCLPEHFVNLIQVPAKRSLSRFDNVPENIHPDITFGIGRKIERVLLVEEEISTGSAGGLRLSSCGNAGKQSDRVRGSCIIPWIDPRD